MLKVLFNKIITATANILEKYYCNADKLTINHKSVLPFSVCNKIYIAKF